MSSLNHRTLPNRIERLHELARDLRRSWNACAGEVFRRLDYPLWRTTNHNPIEMLRLLPDSRFEEVATEPAFLDVYDTAVEKLLAARSGTGTWWRQRYPDMPDISV